MDDTVLSFTFVTACLTPVTTADLIHHGRKLVTVFMTSKPSTRPQKRVIVGLSGGVDSAVAAYRLLEQGYEVEALFMKNWEEDDREGYCAAAKDLADARTVAERLGIRLHTVNFATEYWDRVFAEFLSEYKAMRTPNPDVLCNREIKFAAFLDHALGLGADAIATGHYARVTHDARGSHLSFCADGEKDQTYFLHLLNQDQLSHSLFPLHDLTKPEVRAIAREIGLANAGKRTAPGSASSASDVFGTSWPSIYRLSRDRSRRRKG